jgi:type I restriction-modification system DNA methylase subunit/predicted DNA-binding transcriptional regulator AlpA
MQETLTVGEIAKMTGKQPSAVSNWRTRHADFPRPLPTGASVDVFSLQEVTAWLEKHKRSYTLVGSSVRKAIWLASDIRALPLRTEESVLLLMQLLYIRRRSLDRQDQAGQILRNFWVEVESGQATAQGWSHLAGVLSQDDRRMSEILELPQQIDDSVLQRAAKVVAGIQSDGFDWGANATELLRYLETSLGMYGAYGTTSDSITDLMASLIEPVAGRVYDPACGYGMVLAEAWRRRGDKSALLYGQERAKDSFRLAYLHLALCGATFEIELGDSVRADAFRGLLADRVVAEPPLLHREDFDDLQNDPRWKHGVPPRNADWLWAQHVANHVKDGGTGVMLIAIGALFRSGVDERIRESIVLSNVLDAVIELPPGLVAGTSISTAILVFAQARTKNRGSVLFIDARRLGTIRRGRTRILATVDVQRILSAVTEWRKGTFVRIPRFAAAATIEDIRVRESNLSPSRYVGYDAGYETEIDGEAIVARVKRLREQSASSSHRVSLAAVNLPQVVGAFVDSAGGSWPAVRLGSLLESHPVTGVRNEQGKSDIATPFVETSVVSGSEVRIRQVPEEQTTAAQRNRLARRGDLLLVSRGIDPSRRIKCATVDVDGEIAFSFSLMRLRVDEQKLDPDYLRLYLTSRRGQASLVAVTTGTVIANLRSSALEEIDIPLPPLSVQREISDAMRKIEAELDTLRRAVTTADDLQDTLREAIAGGMYVPVGNEDE